MGDAVAARMKIEQFGGMDFSFRDSREGKLCEALCQSFDDYDPSAMATACMEFDRVSKLDAWKTQILVRVKRNIEEMGGGGVGEDEDEEVDLT